VTDGSGPGIPVMDPALVGPTAGTAGAAVSRPAVRFGDGRRHETTTHVEVAEFQGPLGLLLSLIEARKLDVLTVPLGGLADAYLDALASLEDDRLGNISAFVAVASQLILIKSRAMLDAKHEYERDVAGGTYSAPNPPLRAAGVAPGTDTAQRSAGAGLGPSAAPSTDGSATTRTSAPPPDTGPTRLSPDDVTRTLSSLADLRDRGAISAEEYDRKKSDLLARL
jgi:hypothetical protein